MFGAVFGILLLMGLSAWAAWIILSSSRRSASDVLSDLEALNAELRQARMGADADREKIKGRLLKSDELSAVGLFSSEERRQYLLRRKVTPLVFSIVATLGFFLFVSSNPKDLAQVAGCGLAVGWFATRRDYYKRKESYISALEFQLPIVMERLVMAVQAGLDVISAMQRVIALQGAGLEEGRNRQSYLDPVSRLLELVCQLSDAGLGFEQSLEEVAKLVDCTAVRHAFIHLGMAYKEGGELVMPLMELSDSTQLYYQESVEETIAKMPVKATMPLVVTFGGLIMFFLISPMIQIMEILGDMFVNNKPPF